MTPDASGKFKGISVPSIPWSEKGHGMTQEGDGEELVTPMEPPRMMNGATSIGLPS